MARFDAVWRSLDATVASGWAPGVVAAVRYQGDLHTYATGRRSIGADADASMCMSTDTLFRIASLSKPVGGALALLLAQDGVFDLDDPVARWLPELADPRVLRQPDGPLDQTEAADQPITVRHLLTLTFGLGLLLTECPLSKAISTAGIGPGPTPVPLSADEFMARVGRIPLAYQPGRRWLYHIGSDVLSVLLTRAAGQPLRTLLAERITQPLGMISTSFTAVDPSRLATSYAPAVDGLTVFDPPDGRFARPPRFESLGSGLVSTVTDYVAFLSALADDTLLPSAARAMMTSDQLSAAQHADVAALMGPGRSWGFQVGVDIAATEPWTAIGRYGWTGGSGTSASVDPSRALIGAVFTQRQLSRADESFDYFWAPLVAAL